MISDHRNYEAANTMSQIVIAYHIGLFFFFVFQSSIFTINQWSIFDKNSQYTQNPREAKKKLQSIWRDENIYVYVSHKFKHQNEINGNDNNKKKIYKIYRMMMKKKHRTQTFVRSSIIPIVFILCSHFPHLFSISDHGTAMCCECTRSFPLCIRRV